MKVGYCRVSTEDQNLARQEELMKNWKVEKLFTDKMSGKRINRDGLQAMLDFVREGDVVYVESYSRLARSTKDLFNLVEELEKKGVGFISQKEQCDTTTPQGKLIFTIFAGLCEFEREQILQRTREGVRIAQSQGKYKGRKPIEVNEELFTRVVNDWRQNKITAVKAMQEIGLKPNTFYRRVAEFGKNKKFE